MKTFLIILIFFLIVALQLVFFSRLNIFGASPNLVLALSIAWAIYRREQKLIWLILIPAVWLDLLVGQPFGIFSVGIWASFFFVDWLVRALFKQSGLFSRLVLAVSGILFFELIFRLLQKTMGIFHLVSGQFSFSSFYFFSALPASVFFNTILSLVMLYILSKIYIRPLPSRLSVNKKS